MFRSQGHVFCNISWFQLKCLFFPLTACNLFLSNKCHLLCLNCLWFSVLPPFFVWAVFCLSCVIKWELDDNLKWSQCYNLVKINWNIFSNYFNKQCYLSNFIISYCYFYSPNVKTVTEYFLVHCKIEFRFSGLACVCAPVILPFSFCSSLYFLPPDTIASCGFIPMQIYACKWSPENSLSLASLLSLSIGLRIVP